MARATASLMHIPLVEHVFTQRQVELTDRAIDSSWLYSGIVPLAPAGFDPFGRTVYVPARCRLARWRERQTDALERLNAGEWLLYEVFGAVHDYLHVWAVAELTRELFPDAHGPVETTPAHRDDIEFIYIVSEAVATVGVDFWYLAKLDINDLCPIGSGFVGLTSSYRERDLQRYRAVAPAFRVQEPQFLSWLVDGYCALAFEHFSAADLRRDARLRHWLEHELRMAAKQLRLIRDWVTHLTGWPRRRSRVVEFRSARRRAAVARVAERLWAISHDGAAPVLRRTHLRLPVRRKRPVDYRFTNLLSLQEWPDFDARQLSRLDVRQFAYFTYQYLSAFEFSGAGRERKLRQIVEACVLARDFERLRELTAGLLRPVPGTQGPPDLVFAD